MNNRQPELHELLCQILNCPTRGFECRCYFQPPKSISMKYPAIVYGLSSIKSLFANDRVYVFGRQYVVTVIDKNPNSILVDRIAALPTSRHDRHYEADNLNHDVFELYF